MSSVSSGLRPYILAHYTTPNMMINMTACFFQPLLEDRYGVIFMDFTLEGFRTNALVGLTLTQLTAPAKEMLYYSVLPVATTMHTVVLPRPMI